MESSKQASIYPFHIRLINKIAKKCTNTYWTILDILAYHFLPLSKYIYQNNIKREYDKEHHKIQLTNQDTILHIGCGIYPYSAIRVSKEVDARIIAIDNNKNVIEYAQKIIQKRKLNTKIKIKKAEGSTYNLSSFSVIISSSCVDSSVDVLQNIIKNAQPGTRIIVRELQPMSKYLKEFIERQESLVLENQYTTYTFPFYTFLGWDSFILKKTK